MKPINFPQATRVLGRPADMTEAECAPLAVHDTGGELVSCWLPSADERAAIAAGRPVWLHVVDRGHPPVHLSAVSPFDPAAAPAPASTLEEARRVEFEDALRIGVAAGWEACCLRLAQLSEQSGHAKAAQMFRDFRSKMPPVTAVRVEPGGTIEQAIERDLAAAAAAERKGTIQ